MGGGKGRKKLGLRGGAEVGEGGEERRGWRRGRPAGEVDGINERQLDAASLLGEGGR